MPLEPRDAFYGGRTNAHILYRESDEETKIHYFDICSLYPWVKKFSKIPLGHARVHVGDDCNKVQWQLMDGLMKTTVLAPRGLHFPILPYKMHSKLLFFLCLACAKNFNQGVCDHSVDDRQFTGTWVMDAISKGYTIVRIHEMWEYKVTQYDPVTRTGGLFVDFINRFLKIKAEASGYPKTCITTEQRHAYIQEYFSREGINLDESKIKFNASLKSIAKTMLNSFWGRFGMRDDLPRTMLIRSHEELMDKVMNTEVDCQSILPINDETLLLNYRIKSEARTLDKTTNVVIR